MPLHILTYGKFVPFEVDTPINWSVDPFKAKNWCHHFVSLRWLTEIRSNDVKFTVLKDFYDYHYVTRNHNDLVGTLKGDHTTSFRISQVLAVRAEFRTLPQEQRDAAESLCDALLLQDAQSLLHDQVYRKGHNHGLMADVAVLKAARALMAPQLLEQVKNIIQRGMLTLDEMYTNNGITKEHSISYQEYNYPVAIEFLQLAEHFGEKNGTRWQEKLISATQNLLAFFTRASGDYFPIGDSFRKPNNLIRSIHPQIVPPTNLLRKIGRTGSRLMCVDGFFAYVRRDTKPHIHFVSTCTWHSANHKQDDDASFCLEVDGNLIFDDSGYSDFASADVGNTLRSGAQHSSVRIEGVPFLKRTYVNQGSTILKWDESPHGFRMSAEHQRIGGITIGRIFDLSGSCLHLTDQIDFGDSDSAGAYSLHDFILSPDIRAKIDGGNLHLLTSSQYMGILIAHENDGQWIKESVLHVPPKRTEIGHTARFTYRAPVKSTRRFSFLYFGETPAPTYLSA